jgi:pimeloyl-ACP methyl ester carboxylesterase
MLNRYLAAAALCLAALATQAAERFQDLGIVTRGTGRPVVLLHGLNSSASTWDDLCEHFAREIRCHQIQLPGLAGAPPPTSEHYLTAMRDQVIGYMRAQKLEAPILAGHSLGGVLAMMIAIEDPSLAAGLFIVDSLPFLPAAQNPNATVDIVQPLAEYTRRNMLSLDSETYAQQLMRSAASMVRGADRQEVLKRWTTSSDRATTVNAIYAMMTTDLRADIERIAIPTTILASWSASKPMAGAREDTARTFQLQYSRLKQARIVTTEDANHFIMWDDPALTYRELEQVLTTVKKQP